MFHLRFATLAKPLMPFAGNEFCSSSCLEQQVKRCVKSSDLRRHYSSNNSNHHHHHHHHHHQHHQLKKSSSESEENVWSSDFEVLREKSKKSAKRRRKLENEQFDQLKELLVRHFVRCETTLHKASILRMTMACIRLNGMFGAKNGKSSYPASSSHTF